MGIQVPDVIISAVGDISFEGRLAGSPDITVFSEVQQYMKTCDLGIANLENPLTTYGNKIFGKCTLRGDPGWAAILKDVGIRLVSLANNHMMDYGPVGLFDTIRALDNAGVKHLGAGRNSVEACSPLFMKIQERNIAFHARSAVIVTSPSYAGLSTPGVAFLDADELKNNIAQSRNVADLVIVLMHWGVEEYTYPSPAQVDLARQLVLSGADIIIGHHPHVLQGVHRIENGLVAYSLGNFLFDDFLWNAGGEGKDMTFTLSESNRKGMILQISCQRTGFADVSKVFTRISPEGIMIDDRPERKMEVERLSTQINSCLYNIGWRLYAIKREWDLRVRDTINLSRIMTNFWKIRPSHLKELIRTVRKSLNIARDKSTNPYE